MGLRVDNSRDIVSEVAFSVLGNTDSKVLQITVPGTVTDTQGFTTEQLGSDPLTIWVTLSGSPVSFTLTTPVPV